MNEDLRFDRSYLRRQVWPLIEARWPGAGAALARAARHAAEAQELLERAAAADVRPAARRRCVVRAGFAGARRRGAESMRCASGWAKPASMPPSTARLTEALRQMFEAKADHLPVIVWGESRDAALSRRECS